MEGQGMGGMNTKKRWDGKVAETFGKGKAVLSLVFQT